MPERKMPLGKIDFAGLFEIKDQVSYISRRDIEDKEGNVKGWAGLVLYKDGRSEIEYTCPNCEKAGYDTEGITRAKNGTFTFTCQNCQRKVKLPKLKSLAKKK
ncbi:hypothetical protein ACFLQI_02255 [Candidatus Undinarchaeota archaeon]